MCVVSKNSDDEKYMKLGAKIIYFLQNDQSESKRKMARLVSQPLSSSKKSNVLHTQGTRDEGGAALYATVQGVAVN